MFRHNSALQKAEDSRPAVCPSKVLELQKDSSKSGRGGLYLPIVQTLLPSESRACAHPAAMCLIGGSPDIFNTLGLPLWRVSGSPEHHREAP